MASQNPYALLGSDSESDESAPRRMVTASLPEKKAEKLIPVKSTRTQLQTGYCLLVEKESYQFQRFINQKLWFDDYNKLAVFLKQERFILIRLGEHQDCWVHFATRTLLRAKHNAIKNKVTYTLGMLYQNPLKLEASGKNVKVNIAVLQNRNNEAYKLCKGQPIPSKHEDLDGTYESLTQMKIAHVKFRKESTREQFEQVTNDYCSLNKNFICRYGRGCTHKLCRFLHPGQTVVQI